MKCLGNIFKLIALLAIVIAIFCLSTNIPSNLIYQCFIVIVSGVLVVLGYYLNLGNVDEEDKEESI
jgi:hypothetical protein